MKRLYILILLFFFSAFHASAQYITVWNTDGGGVSGNTQIIIPATGTDYSIAWEEVGDPTNNGSTTGSGIYTLNFPSPGTYQVSITPGSGTFTRVNFGDLNDVRDSNKLLEIRRWGNIQWEVSGLSTTYLLIGEPC